MAAMANTMIKTMVSLAKEIQSKKIGYAQDKRWGFLDRKNKKIIANKSGDCSSIAAGIAWLAGYNVNIDGALWTGNLDVVMKRAGWRVFKNPKITDGVPGSMFLKKGHHVVTVISKTQWLSAESNEKGRATGGKDGDQTGREIVIRKPYNRSGGWDFLLVPPAESETPKVRTITVDEINSIFKRAAATLPAKENVDLLVSDVNGSDKFTALSPQGQATFIANLLAFSNWLRTYTPDTFSAMVAQFEAKKLWDEAAEGDLHRITCALQGVDKNSVPSGWTQRLIANRACLAFLDPPVKLKVDGDLGAKTISRLQEFVGAEIDGEIGPQTELLIGLWSGFGKPLDLDNKNSVKSLQKKVGLSTKQQDGVWRRPQSKKFGTITTKALQSYLNANR